MLLRFAVVCGLILVVFGRVGRAAVGNEKSLKPATPTACVEVRHFAGMYSVGPISPGGNRLAYVVEFADSTSNKNVFELYVRGIDDSGARNNGRIVFETNSPIAKVRWLSDNRLIFLVGEQNHSSVRIIDIDDHSAEYVTPVGMQVSDYAASADGRTVIYSVVLPPTPKSGAQSPDPQLYGHAITFGQVEGPVAAFMNEFLGETSLYYGTRSENEWVFHLLPLHRLGELTAENTLPGVNQLNLSPSGKYLLFTYNVKVLPAGWSNHPLAREWRRFGNDPPALVLYEIATGRTRLAFDAPMTISPNPGDLTTKWADDSLAFSVTAGAPLGSSRLEVAERESVHYKNYLTYAEGHAELYVVPVDTLAPAFVSTLKFSNDLPLAWTSIRGAIYLARSTLLERLVPSAGGWHKQDEWRLSAALVPATRVRAASDGRSWVGAIEGPTTPPEIFLQDLTSRMTHILTKLNAAAEELDLGKVSEIKYDNGFGDHVQGYLITPPDMKPGTRYPLIILAKNWGDTPGFLCDTYNRTAFAPQVLAGSGFVVLMMSDLATNSAPRSYPGEISEAFAWMSAVESGIATLDSQGIIDPKNVGISGFSRTGFLVDFMLTHSMRHFAAATSADSGLFTYRSYVSLNARAVHEAYEKYMGGPPFGTSLEAWLAYSPPFSAKKMRTPLLMEYIGISSDGGMEFFTALKRLGKPVEYYVYPRGEHELNTPWERVASLQRNVDWFRFWMQGYERPNPEDEEQYVRWRDLRAQHEWNEHILASNRDPSAEFLRQTAFGSSPVRESTAAPAAKEFVH